jgi:hypothetical protein
MKPRSSVGQKGGLLPVVAVVAAAIVAPTAVVLADPNCIPCTCTGLGTCNGCQIATTPGQPLAGLYVNVTNSTIVTTCETSTGLDSCVREKVVCWSINAGQNVNIFADEYCETPAGMAQGPLEFKMTGCTGSGGGA